MVVDSATSQFFINLENNAFLDHSAPNPRQFGYAVFGRITKGMDVVDKIALVKTGSVGYFQDVPVEPVVIMSVKVNDGQMKAIESTTVGRILYSSVDER